MHKATLFVMSLLLVPHLAFAQTPAPLPSAGITPESSWYFLDTLGEALREFFAFSPETKARLQLRFAAERVAEIKIMLETKGVEAKGLAVAQERLQSNLAKANAFMNDRKSKGEDVREMAAEINDRWEGPKLALEETFRTQQLSLGAQAKELAKQLKAAQQAGDTAKAETLAQQLAQIKDQLNALRSKENDIDDDLEDEEDKIEEELEDRTQAEEAIREAEEKKAEMLKEFSGAGVTIPAAAFTKFDRLVAQAKELLAKENYQGAKQLAKQAEKDLEKDEEDIQRSWEDEREDAKQQEEQEREGEKKEAEAVKKQSELREEAVKKAAEREEEAAKQAAERQKEAEEQQKEAERD